MAMEVAGAVRNAYNAEGRMFVVAGQTLYQITPGGVSVPLGTIPGVGRVSFSHNQITNGNEILINNGNAGYIYNTVTQVFQRITDTSYPGGLRAVFINNRFVQIEPARRYVFNSDLADGLNYNALDRFTSETSPDLVMGIESIGNQLAVFSSTTTEWFEDTGANPQPFRSTGIVADKGAAGPFCTAKLDNQLFFLADDGVFYRYQGYNPVRISTKPIEQSIRNKNWFNAFTTVWEDSGYAVCYWTFPDGLTWGYDASTGKWHRRESYGFNRWRLNSLTYWQNKWYGGDFQAGKLYELDWDYILEGDQEFISYRSAGAISDNQNRVIHERLELIVNTGMRETEAVAFVDQPEGPTLGGEAPDGLEGQPYSFSYTATPGSAPIARTVIRDGTYVERNGEQITLSEAGFNWNQSTATISSASPGEVIVHLVLRTYDTNGLYADHEDEFLIAQVNNMLVTGSSVSGPVFARAIGAQEPEFTGIATGTGADIAQARANYYDGTYTAVANGTLRYSTDLSAWSTASTPWGSNTAVQVWGGPVGWLIRNNQFGTEGAYGKASQTPADLASYTFSVDGSSQTTISMVSQTNGIYYADLAGSGSGTLVSSEDLGVSWTKLCDRNTSTPGSVGNNAIVVFLDIVEFGGALYATVLKNINVPTQRAQLRRSDDGGQTWPVILVDNLASGIVPWQLCISSNTLVCLSWGGEYAYSSQDDYAEAHATGVGTNRSSEVTTETRGRQIAFGGGYFHVISGDYVLNPSLGNKVVTSMDGITFGAPISMPITSLVSICSSWEE